MIEIKGLTPKEVVLCDIMWELSSKEGVEQFIASLPSAEQRQCRVLIELMQLAFLDEVNDTHEAVMVIDKIVKP